MSIRTLIAALLVAGTGLAQAAVSTVPIVGNVSGSIEGSGATFSGRVSYDDATHQLLITLRNDTPAALGGYLTAFAFNAPGSASLSFVGSTLDSFASFLSGPNAAPFTGFEYGVGTGSPFSGGGVPSQGLGSGASASWTFLVSGGGFTAADFLFADGGLGTEAFVGRFRGFANGGSDKVPGSVVPEPGSYALMLAGLGVLGLLARRRRG